MCPGGELGVRRVKGKKEVTLSNGEGKGDGEERGKEEKKWPLQVLSKKEAGLGPEPDSRLSPPEHKGLLG